MLPLVKVLDLFCCEGGATRGYDEAGHIVRGVDLDASHEAGYLASGSGEWNRATWESGLADLADWADFIHASPPCQGYSVVQNGTYGESKQERLIPIVRAALRATGKPFVIENVGGARKELIEPIALTGDMFHLGATLYRSTDRPEWVYRGSAGRNSKGEVAHRKICSAPQIKIHARVHRIRYFEFGNMATPLLLPDRDLEWAKGRVNFSITNGSMTDDFHRLGHRDPTIPERQALLGIDWGMTKLGLAEALPPAYTRWIGEQITAVA